MLNILVTGANGQLGNEIRLRATASRHNYLFTDVAELDITDPEAVRHCVTANRIDAIVNCAAYTNVDKAEEDEAAADRINRLAPAYLAAAAREAGATLVHISTDYVFQGDAHLPYDEEQPTEPLGVYGRTKLAGELAVKESGCNYLIFRTAWLYSRFGNNFVKTMLRLTAEREALNVVFDQVGTPTHAGDLADAVCGILEAERHAGNQGVYHFSDEGVCSWYDFAVEIARLAGNDRCDILPCHTSEFPSKVRRPAFSVLDKTKVKATFGIRIPHWRDSLATCIETLKQ